MEGNIEQQYLKLLNDILENGIAKKDRTGTGTLSVFGRTIRHKMSEGFPLLTTKKMYFKGIVTELLWFLRGDTNIKYLVDNDCHIWDGDAYKRYWNSIETSEYDGFGPTSIKLSTLTKEEFVNKIKTDDEFAKKWGDLGPVYGKQWRGWEKYLANGHNLYFDQIANLINDLKTNPDSRRLMVSAWNVGELDSMTLPPCHYGFQVYTRELSMEEREELYRAHCMKHFWAIKLNQTNEVHYERANIPTRAISLMWNQRSVDTFLGLPFNIASYGLLLEIIAKAVNMVPDELIGNLGDTHLYLNHIEQAKEQIGRELTHEERHEMLKEAMGPLKYQSAVDEQVPFGGGLSEYYDIYKIPYRTREPYQLSTLKHMKTDDFYKSLSEDLSLINHLENTDFVLANYQSHPTIKASLSN